MIIYKVTNTTNNKCYIGKTTKTLDERKKSHLKNFRLGKKSKFYNAIKKYGVDKFTWEELIKCENNDILNEMEIFFIKKYNSFNNGYNSTLGGEGGDTISMKSKEEKKNQGAKINNIPWNKGISMRKLGHNFYDNRKKRNPFTDEEKKKLSISILNSEKYKKGLKNRKHGMSKQVIRKNDGKIWPTIKDCANEIGFTKEMVRYNIINNRTMNNEIYFFK